MNKIKVLVEGYCDFEDNHNIINYSSAVLIERENGEKIVFDPGSNKEKLTASLAKINLDFSDINYTFISHKHIDHLFLASHFTNAALCTANSVYKGINMSRHSGQIWDESLKIIRTPGHIIDHSSLLVETEDGVVCLAGDLWWWDKLEVPEFDDMDYILHKLDPFAYDAKLLIESRKKVMELADWVIPGHGQKFKVIH